MHQPPLLRCLFATIVVLAVTPPCARTANGQTATVDRDPIEGRWLGKVGFPEDRVDIGIEFKRDEKGEVVAYLYQPVVNFYGLKLGAVKLQDGHYVASDFPFDLILSGERLEGTYFPLKAPISLGRTETLPAEVAVPDLPAGPGPSWQVKLGGAIYAPAAIRGGVVYVGTTGGMFYAVDRRDGAFVWSFAAGRAVLGGALVTEEHVYFACDNGYLFKLDRATGKEVWRYDLGDARIGRVLEHQVVTNSGDFDFDHAAPQPVLLDGVLFVGSGDGRMHGVNAESGKPVWTFEAKGKIRTDAVIVGDRVVFGTLDGIVYAVTRDVGREVWKKETRAAITASPALVDGRIIVGNRGGLLAALDAATGATLWRMLFWGSAVESTAAPLEGSLFSIGSSDMRRVSVIDAKDGRVVWRTDVFGWAWPRPAVAGNRIYCSVLAPSPYEIRHYGSLVALDRETGRVVWRWAMPVWPGSFLNGFAAAPVVDGDSVVVGGLDGTLYAFRAG
ncbi:MAG: PQQ-binding-like beta-propeller repeat protein [Blastocatellia bacterium]|jgi:outer membrane protein assembly factor BamB|nr:PQQ-binding-like beta-propeller repeat protein [Blastocatellia bacterium]